MTIAFSAAEPQFSIITPVFNPPRDAFEACVESVFTQTNPDWEWCLVDDCSTEAWVSQRLRDLQAQDTRIRVHFRSTNGGIVAASNDALSLASGVFVVLLDNDDELHADALALVSTSTSQSTTCDYVYSDEDKISTSGQLFDEFKKPRWSPERLLGQNYTSHLSVLRRSLVDEVGRFRTGFDGSQDYDLVLRVIERARLVVHIPEVLYHWRALPSSTASSANAKPYAFIAAMKAVREHLERLGIAASVTEAGPSLAAVNRTLKQRPLVSLVTAIDGAKSRSYGVDSLLGEQLIASITGNTKYRNYELVMVVPSNLPESQQQELLIQAQGRGRFVNVAPGTALAAALNVGLLSTSSEFVGLIDQRCEITDESWLEILLSYIIAKDVALAAPTLTDSFGLVYSAGLGLTPEPHHVGAGRLISDLGAVGMFGIARESLGVSTACVVARAATLQAVGGLSQEFVGRMFDFDLACKLYQGDKRCIITPRTSVRIHGSEQVNPADLEAFRSRWGRFIANDPYTRIDTRLQLAMAAHSVS